MTTIGGVSLLSAIDAITWASKTMSNFPTSLRALRVDQLNCRVCYAVVIHLLKSASHTNITSNSANY